MASMTQKEFSTLKEKLGLSAKEIGELLGVTERTVFRWLSGESEIDDLKAASIRRIVQRRKAIERPAKKDFVLELLDAANALQIASTFLVSHARAIQGNAPSEIVFDSAVEVERQIGIVRECLDSLNRAK